MKQHKASSKQGSQRHTPRSGAPRKPTARKAAGAKPAARANKSVPKTVAKAASKARGTKAAVVQIAPAAPIGFVKLASECLIGTLDGLRDQLIECMAIETLVSLDAAAVERIDTAALQLLAAFTRDRKAAGLPMAWSAVSVSLTDAAALLNLTAVLALDAEAESMQVAA